MGLWSKIEDAVADVTDAVEDFVNDIGDTVGDALETVGDGINDALNWLGEKVGIKPFVTNQPVNELFLKIRWLLTISSNLLPCVFFN